MGCFTIDTYVAQVSLRSLCHAHLQVDGIAVDVDFGRIDAGEHVTVVVNDTNDKKEGMGAFLEKRAANLTDF